MKIIAISGKAGSGKTTLANNLAIALGTKKGKVPLIKIIKFAKPLYDLQHAVQTTLYKEVEKNRQLLLGIGDLIKKVYGEHVFTDYMYTKLKNLDTTEDYVIIDDMRFMHELHMIYPNFNALTVRLDGPISLLDTRVEVKADRNHISEIALDSAAFDLYINIVDKSQEEVLNEVINNL